MDLIFDLFWPFMQLMFGLLVLMIIVLPDMGRLMIGLLVAAIPIIFPYRLFTGDKAMPPKDRIIALVLALCLASPAMAGGHQRMVRASGITPRQVGSYEGVGMSTRSYIDARNNACYWGKRTPLSIQYSYRNGRYYAVVRYQ